MNTNECMEYSQKYANAQGSTDRNEARGELRKQIDLTVAAAVAAERERIANLWAGCATEAEGHGLVDVGASIRAGKLIDA